MRVTQNARGRATRLALTLRHGNIQAPDSERARIRTIGTICSGADVVTLNEAQHSKALVLAQRDFAWHYQGDNAIGWKRGTREYPVQEVHRGSRLIMPGGHLGSGVPGDRRRRGPDRYMIWTILDVAGVRTMYVCTHTIARAGRLRWRRPLLFASLSLAFAVVRRKRRRYGVENVVFVGDLNWAGRLLIGDLTEQETPGTLGRSRYDRVYLGGRVTVRGQITDFPTESDHDGLNVPLVVHAK